MRGAFVTRITSLFDFDGNRKTFIELAERRLQRVNVRLLLQHNSIQSCHIALQMHHLRFQFDDAFR